MTLSFSQMDKVTQQNAAKPQKAETKVAAEKAIPLNDSEDFSDFNS